MIEFLQYSTKLEFTSPLVYYQLISTLLNPKILSDNLEFRGDQNEVWQKQLNVVCIYLIFQQLDYYVQLLIY